MKEARRRCGGGDGVEVWVDLGDGVEVWVEPGDGVDLVVPPRQWRGRTLCWWGGSGQGLPAGGNLGQGRRTGDEVE